MSMFRKVLFAIGLLLTAQVAAIAQGTLRGSVKDDQGEPLYMAVVKVLRDGNLVRGAMTDFDGMYTVSGLDVGKYDIEVSYTSMKPILKKGVSVKANDYTLENFVMKPSSTVLDVVEVVEERVPIIDMGGASTGKRMNAEDIQRMPGADVSSIVASVGGVGYNSDGSAGAARGETGMVTNVGGVRTRAGVNVPKEAIEEIQVILGGTPASIGESVGGAQIITLKPPQPKFFGMVRYETYFNYQMNHMLTAYFTGPMWVKRTQTPEGGVLEMTKLGYRFTAEASYYNFGYYRPSDRRYKVVDDNIVMQLEQNPIIYDPEKGSIQYAGENLLSSDFVEIKRPTANNYYANKDRYSDFSGYYGAANLALVYRFSEYSTLELTTEFVYSKGPSTSISYFPLNLTRAAFGVKEQNSFKVQADFQQRFRDAAPAAGDATLPPAKKGIKNAMFQVNLLYNRIYSRNYNENFGDDVFKYGHIGTFVTQMIPSYDVKDNINYNGTVQTARVLNSYNQVITGFTPSEYNPILANYTEQLRHMDINNISSLMYSRENILAYNGLMNGDSPASIHGLFSNVGVQNTSYGESVSNYIYVGAKASASLGPHELEIGYQIDYGSQSAYSLGAYSLWTIMRQNANAHITQLDLSNPIYRVRDGFLYVDYNRLNGGGQTYFDASMREALGLDVNGTDWLDVDSYSPDWYQQNGGINMFSSKELFNSGNQIVNYYGYDHTGKRYNGSGWSLDDFFDPVSKGHENFQYLRSFAPTYMGAYIQDKFAFEDLVFNVGVRVDYFDANQDVLKDPYLLYESYTVGDLKGGAAPYNTGLANNAFANAAQDDWVVYVDDPAATTPTIRGYRNGRVWYNAEGVEVSSHSQVVGESGRPTPYRTTGAGGGQEVATLGNASGNQVSSASFEDYKPQIVPMPRIAFSFPVGLKSQFKANYDIIARRPSGGWQADYLSYMYMTKATVISNPNLKPERVTNYEVAFEQALTDNMAVSLSAYYKETRDLIQLVQYGGADPNQNYYSYDNLDFKTTKGFTFSYNMRGTNNLSISANYTLQYAEGTGISSTTMQELIKEGYTTLKMLNPIGEDQRHVFKVNVDFRYGDGPKYNGWRYNRTVKDKETGELKKKEVRPFENAGINIMAVAQSGAPYTRALSITQPYIVGSYNGARLPWAFYFDMIADKVFNIDIHKKDGVVKHTQMRVSVTVTNLFNIRNTIGVFAATGNPDDNGYLTDPSTQSVINSNLNPQSFRDLYAIYLNNSYFNYNPPRQVKLGITYMF